MTNATFQSQFLGKCNGVQLNGVQLTAEDRVVFNTLFPDIKKRFCDLVRALPDYNKLEHASHKEGIFLGHRVSSAGLVMDRLRGLADKFSENPEAWMMDAMYDCSTADYWYEFEKEW